jgi:hypothetical protein
MSFRRKSPAILLALALGASIAGYGIDKDKVKFAPGPASSYADKQTISGVTIGVEAFTTEEQAQKAFGKVNPYQKGVLPVLVVIHNDTQQAIKLDGADFQYVTPNKDHLDPTPAKELPYIHGPKRPNFSGQWPIPLPSKKNPLADPVFDERAFVAKMIPPGDSAYGFFYYQTGHRRGSQLYIRGLREAQTGNELFFFEIPMYGR